MKALSLTQPWATLVAIGAKHIETRSWGTNYRGPIAIHASKSFPGWAKELCFYDGGNPYIYRALKNAGITRIEQLPLGKVLCTTELIDDQVFTRLNVPLPPEYYFGDFTLGRHGLYLSSAVHRFETPIPAKGALGLWEWKRPEGVTA